ncbi:TetR family transcriptional regulator [Paracoccus sp. Z118]|uniref:TetR/AcrR family transcriptional regulator n=1 Tax=Paracoccus sp. Z118 TaxID=2851017 RepID=UPI001C2C15B1|nr:TetR family transcriptional regulator [Paracoccus sp. Z118]MBV0892352.1 TetR family transcriptional regulator [Paracoccus sp. Z118]
MRRSKEDSEQTRSAILDAAERAFCGKGFASTSLEAISRAAGVTRGAFYWHFKDKTDLLAALHERSFVPQQEIIAAMTAAGEGDPLARLESAGPAILRSFEADARQQRMFLIMSDLTTGREGAAWVARIDAEMRDMLRQMASDARDCGALNPAFTPEEAAVFLMVTFHGILSEWMRSDKGFPLSGLGTKMLSHQIASLRAGAPGHAPDGLPRGGPGAPALDHTEKIAPDG